MQTLYWAPGASSIAPHIVLEEIGNPYRLELVQIDQQGTAEILTSPAYLKINPKGRVPALTVGDRVLTETPAIMTYLARRHPEAQLLPKDPEAEARCFEWMNWLSTAIHAIAFGQIVRPQRFVTDAKDYPAVVARGRQNAATAFGFIEQQLQGRTWTVSDQYTIADAYLLFFYLGSKRAGNPMRERYPAWSQVAERALERPAVRRVLEQEDMSA
jgi:glutathione S-transferase